MTYTAEHDPLCYPGTHVLINFAGLLDQAELDQFELAMYLTRAEEPCLPEFWTIPTTGQFTTTFFRTFMPGPARSGPCASARVGTGSATPNISPP